jgi:hypothetical protein
MVITCCDRPAGRVDIEGDCLFWVLRLEKEELSYDGRGIALVDGTIETYYSLLEDQLATVSSSGKTWTYFQ